MHFKIKTLQDPNNYTLNCYTITDRGEKYNSSRPLTTQIHRPNCINWDFKMILLASVGFRQHFRNVSSSNQNGTQAPLPKASSHSLLSFPTINWSKQKFKEFIPFPFAVGTAIWYIFSYDVPYFSFNFSLWFHEIKWPLSRGFPYLTSHNGLILRCTVELRFIRSLRQNPKMDVSDNMTVLVSTTGELANSKPIKLRLT